MLTDVTLSVSGLLFFLASVKGVFVRLAIVTHYTNTAASIRLLSAIHQCIQVTDGANDRL